jgi:uncharacterized tellurite resistance protein B-like protein
MNELTYKQKIAMMRILLDLILADKRVDVREDEYFTQIASVLGLDEDSKSDVKEKNSLLALSEIRDFHQKDKETLAKLMGEMIVVDEDINYNEVRLYNVVNDFCNINIEFQIEDYPNYSISGEEV